MEVKELVRKLSEAVGVSGYEARVAKIIKEEIDQYATEVKINRMGSVIAFKEGDKEKGEVKVILTAHMDEVGMIATKIEEKGFLRLTTIGLDTRILPGQEVIVHGKEDLRGIIGAKPPHLQIEEERKKAVKLEDMFIDLGLSQDKVKELVRVGDPISFAKPFLSLRNGFVSGKSLDDRAGVAALIETFRLLTDIKHSCDLYGVFTVQEESTGLGAMTSAYEIYPDLAIAVDVTFGAMPGVPSKYTFDLGKGLVFAIGPNVHPKLYELLTTVADEEELSYSIEPNPRSTGTDAMPIQVARAGIPTAVVSIPLRYMHTAVETASLSDITRTGKFLARVVGRIDEGIKEGLRCF